MYWWSVFVFVCLVQQTIVTFCLLFVAVCCWFVCCCCLLLFVCFFMIIVVCLFVVIVIVVVCWFSCCLLKQTTDHCKMVLAFLWAFGVYVVCVVVLVAFGWKTNIYVCLFCFVVCLFVLLFVLLVGLLFCVVVGISSVFDECVANMSVSTLRITTVTRTNKITIRTITITIIRCCTWFSCCLATHVVCRFYV